MEESWRWLVEDGVGTLQLLTEWLWKREGGFYL
jgi:hypothetical protein